LRYHLKTLLEGLIKSCKIQKLDFGALVEIRNGNLLTSQTDEYYTWGELLPCPEYRLLLFCLFTLREHFSANK
jgi:hypothetical protein